MIDGTITTGSPAACATGPAALPDADVVAEAGAAPIRRAAATAAVMVVVRDNEGSLGVEGSFLAKLGFARVRAGSLARPGACRAPFAARRALRLGDVLI